MPALLHSALYQLPAPRIGKVRDVYDLGSEVLIVATDRISAFDAVMANGIPNKGCVLNQMSAFWFDQTKDIIPNHVLDVPDPNVLIAKKCRPLPLEVIVRGYITGVTDTALWTLYQSGQRDFGNFVLPDGLKKNQRLASPVLTPTTKSTQHDRPLTPRQIVDEKILSQNLWDEVADKATQLFLRGQAIAKRVNLILVDTKYEFGLDEQGKLMLIDEIHTPDSSRYWQADTYETKFTHHEEPEYFDKEFLRLWFKAHCDPYQDLILPKAPKDMIMELSRRYIQIFEKITQRSFEHDINVNMTDRIAHHLSSYHI